MSEPESTPGRKGRSKKKKPRSWRRTLFRSVSRVIVIILLLIAGVLTFVGLAPLSGARLDAAFKARWLTATGVDLDYSSADITLVTGLVRVIAPRLIDPDSGEQLASLSSFEVRLDLGSFIHALLVPGFHAQVRRITVQGPLDLHFEEDNGRVGFSPRLRRLSELIQKRIDRAPSGESISVDIDSIMLSDADFNLDRLKAGEATRLSAITNTFMLIEFQRGRTLPTNINLVGKLVGNKGSTGLSLQLRLNEVEDEMRMKLRINPIDSRSDLLGRPPMDFQTGEISADGLLRRQGPGDWILKAETSTPRITLVGAGVHGIDHSFQDSVIETWIRWRNEDKKLELLDFQANSKDCSLGVRGELNLVEPYHYDLDLKQLELRGQAVALTERSLFGENRITTPDQGVLRIVGKLGGSANVLKPESIDGEFSVAELTLALPNLPEPVHSVALKAHITNDEIKIVEGSALVQGLPLAVSGNIVGRPLKGEIDAADFEWKISGELVGLSPLLDRDTRTADWKLALRGGVTGSGTLHSDNVQIEHLGEVLDHADIKGRLSFNNAELRSAKLTQPIQRLNGALDFDRNEARLSDLSGSIEDVNFKLSGKVEGQDVFWKNGMLDAQMTADFSIGSVPEIFRWVGRKPPDLPESAGKIVLSGQLRAPLENPDQATLKGSLRATDLSLTLDRRNFAGTISIPILDADMDRRKIEIGKTRGTWGDIGFEITGNIRPDGGELQAKAEGDASSATALIPPLGKEFSRIAGQVDVTSQIRLTRNSGAKPLDDLVQAWQELSPKTENPDTAGPDWQDFWKVDVDGEGRISEGELLQQSMPATALLTDIYGTLKFNREKCWSDEPVYLKPSTHSETAQTTVLIAYPADEAGRLSLDFNLRGSKTNIDDWIPGWKKRTPEIWNDQEPDRSHPHHFSVAVNVASDQVVYHDLQGNQLTGRIRFDSWGKREDKLVWEDAHARFGQGEAFVQGRLETRGEREEVSHQIEGKNLEVADLSRAFLKKEGMISSGRVTGTISLDANQVHDPVFQSAGQFKVEGSRFISNSIFRGVGSLLKLNTLFNDISFTTIEGRFRVVDDEVIIDKSAPVVFENPSALHPLSLNVSGKVGAGQRTDLLMSVQFFPIVGNIPLLGEIWSALTGRIIRLNVQGSLQDPSVSLAAPML